MTFRRRTMRLARLLVAGLTVVTSSLVGPHLAWADGVDQAQQNVDKTLAELENLQDQLGQLDEDYSAALDRQDQLAAEIQQAQADGAIDPGLPPEVVLYTIFARACDPVPGFLKAAGQMADDQIVDLVLRTCFSGLRTR